MKTTKYSDEDTQILIDLYNKNTAIPDIALAIDRTERSVTAKLSSLGLYSKQPYTAKDGSLPKKKIEYVQEISVLCDAPEELMDSLEKCTKFVLKKLLDTLKNVEKN